MIHRQEIFNWAKEQYGTEPEYLWMRTPNYAVLRHGDSGKWYGAVLDIPSNYIGLPGEEIIDILLVKSDPVLIGALLKNEGFFPAYHMSKSNWISILLDGSVPWEQICDLLSFSYELVTPKRKRSRKKAENQTEAL